MMDYILRNDMIFFFVFCAAAFLATEFGTTVLVSARSYQEFQRSEKNNNVGLGSKFSTTKSNGDAFFNPRTFSSNDLKRGAVDDGDSDLQKELKIVMHSDGIIVVTDIPGNFTELKIKVYEGIAKCQKYAPAVHTMDFSDGSKRYTLASFTDGLGNLSSSSPIDFGFSDTTLDDLKLRCSDEEFLLSLEHFRAKVSEVTRNFVKIFTKTLNTKVPMLKHKEKDAEDFANLQDVLERSRHLEHFHNYVPLRQNEKIDKNDDDVAAVAKTIDMHSDQGIFIAFVPGLVVEEDEKANFKARPDVSAGDFFIQKADSSLVKCDFVQSKAEIVIMLGDAVEHLINRDLTDKISEHVRSVPHGMSMPGNLNTKQSRVWYGRMFLPPEDALSKLHDESLTYGDIGKQQMEAIKNGYDGVGFGVGCSRRQLAGDAPSCADNQIFCWRRCMNYTVTASPSICAVKKLNFNCVSQRDQIWDGNSHGDYNPMCTNSSEPMVSDSEVAPVPSRNDSACTNFDLHVNQMSIGYTKEVLTNKTTLLYRVTVADELDVKMIYDGKVGWMSIGIENAGGKHNGMNGAHIVMGIYEPTNYYQPNWALQTYKGTGVGEYIIDPTNSAFRHWKNETHDSLAMKEIYVGNCYSTLSFTTSGRAIAGKPLVFDGISINSMIWGVHTTSLLKGSHGSTRGGAEKKRGHVNITAIYEKGPSSGAPTFTILAVTVISTILTAAVSLICQ